HDTTTQLLHDARRTAWLAEQGITVFRVPASDVLDEERLETVLQAIVQAAAPSTAFGGPPPPQRGGGSPGATTSDMK
ncbi:MAG: hypothetical protein AB7K64_18730, partial [Variibacter sp.]